MAKRWVGCDVEEHFFGDDRKSSKKSVKSPPTRIAPSSKKQT